MLFKQPQKVVIFGHDDRTCITCREKNFVVTLITQPKLTHCLGIDLEILAKPGS